MTVGASLRGFVSELRRRRVVRVMVVYGVVAWAMVQVAATVGPALDLPDWTDSFVVLMALIGFPLAVILAWAYEVTPDGVRRTEDPESSQGAPVTPAATSGGVITRPPPGRRSSPLREQAVRPKPVPDTRPVAPASPGDLRRAILATLRHELRTPLNAVIGYAEFLLEDLPADRTAPLRSILTAGQKNLLLVNEILRPDAAEEELTDESLARMRRGIREEMSGPTERLVELCAEAKEATRDVGEVAAEDLDRLTEAATRLRDLVRSELAAVTSADGFGATNGPTRELAARVIAGLPRGGTGDELPPRHGQILVVDDNETNRDLLSRQLARQGFSVSLASDGEAALEMLRVQDFDLVLLDVLMPGLDGIGVLTRMQRDAPTAEIPVIMTSAMDEIEGVVRCIEQGAVDYLIKPFDPVLLQARVAATLDLHRLRAAQRRARQELEAEVAWSDRLIHSLVPGVMTERVRDGRGTLVETHENVTTLAVYLQGLGTFAMRSGGPALAEWMGEVTGAFEEIARDFPLEIHWEGGATLIASTGTNGGREEETEAIAELALRLREEGLSRVAGAEPVRVGIGIHSGAAVSALIDADRLAFGLWGEAPDVARELAWQCPAGEVQVSPAGYAALHVAFNFESRGIIETSFRSQMRVYQLVGRREAPAGGGR